ncbi:MAG: kinase, aspartokinase/uridylate kinase [Candidatus Syntrophoarchaeum caldarius]|uniref:Kinase, aspartokinase/uridylate kinase n=1 Tax=Candidatus Syntropharchaeum caldarium TaxID=1838285 RepID=A0A1F2P9K6_9EURY|nr:MAG: kinase, aspartokinase/uridylate kinase [Candidatus Syntrophoarchaeum caldarius]
MTGVIVIKVGGSLIDESNDLLECLKDIVLKKDLNIVIVPGGGVFADQVRRYTSNISDDASHLMAILAMDQYGIYLGDTGGIRLIDRFEDLGRSNNISILLLSQIMRAHDPLPHTWDVTSDTIAAWVAKELGAKFLKLTDVDGVFHDGNLLLVVSARKLRELELSCTDRALPDFLIKHGMDCTVLNGRYPERILDAIEERAFKGTLIKGVDKELEACFQ